MSQPDLQDLEARIRVLENEKSHYASTVQIADLKRKIAEVEHKLVDRLIPIELSLQRLGTTVSNAIGTARWIVPVIVTIAMGVMALIVQVIVSANS